MTWCLSKQAFPKQALRGAVFAIVGALALFGIVFLAYELAVARVPQHRASLERLVRAQTGLDIRFDELGLRWGWYGPEAVFRRVELGEPRKSTVVLKAPELVVGFDVWQTMRTGQLEAGRITLVAADIDFGRPPSVGRSHGTAAAPTAQAIKVLEGWQGGRVDLEGGTLRIPDPGGSANPVTLQIRRASLRRASSEWSGYGLVFLPEKLGRSARVVLRVDGNLEKPDELDGSVRFEGRRLAFAGWRDLAGASSASSARYLPRAGSGDLSLEVDFAHGRVVKASGKVAAGGLELAPNAGLDRVKGEWHLAQRPTGWRLQVESLELGESTPPGTVAPGTTAPGVAAPGSLSLEAAADGSWIRGALDQASLDTVVALSTWLVPQLDLSQTGVSGTASKVVFDWNRARPAGQRLRAAARLSDVAIAPQSRDFSLTGLAGRLSGDESDLVAELATRSGKLELSQTPFDGVHVDARLRINRAPDGAWRVETEKLEVQHQNARLRVDGTLTAQGLQARAELKGVDVPLLKKLSGDKEAFAQLTGGNIESAAIELNGSRVRAVLDQASLQAVAGVPPVDALHGTLVFEDGHLRRSVLTGQWLGGPVALTVSERRDHGLAVQGRGMLDARQLALLATAGTVIDQTRAPSGQAEWSGELAFLEGGDWHVRVDSRLVGITSQLPSPLNKVKAAPLPLHVEAQGTQSTAQLRLDLGGHLRSLVALKKRNDATWRIDRGSVQFGGTPAALPSEPVVLVEGRLSQLDLPAYVAAWQQLRAEPAAPSIRAALVATELLVAGKSYSEVSVSAQRSDAGADMRLQSPEIDGTAHWPALTNIVHPARFHFAKLNVPDGEAFAASAELVAALGPATEFSVDDVVWAGHSIGSAAATIESRGDAVNVTDLHLVGSTQEASGTMRCVSTACRLKFSLDSTNGAATLEDFGFRPDLTASKATLDGDLQWQVGGDQPPLATLAGRLDMRLEDGFTGSERGSSEQGAAFGLLLVPALLSGMGEGLHFASLEAGFDVSGGKASTSDLHFDGDAEILMRGRTDLVARDYDQQVWILRGEGRLPAVVRRLGPTPRVAAAWLSIRELFTGSDRSKAPLHLQGTWDDPIVVALD